MPTLQETAYPTLKRQISKETLERVYTPSAEEIAFVNQHSRTPQIRACMLTQLKCAQRLGHFIFLRKIPRYIPKYIAGFVGCRFTVKEKAIGPFYSLPQILKETRIGREF